MKTMEYQGNNISSLVNSIECHKMHCPINKVVFLMVRNLHIDREPSIRRRLLLQLLKTNAISHTGIIVVSRILSMVKAHITDRVLRGKGPRTSIIGPRRSAATADRATSGCITPTGLCGSSDRYAMLSGSISTGNDKGTGAVGSLWGGVTGDDWDPQTGVVGTRGIPVHVVGGKVGEAGHLSEAVLRECVVVDVICACWIEGEKLNGQSNTSKETNRKITIDKCDTLYLFYRRVRIKILKMTTETIIDTNLVVQYNILRRILSGNTPSDYAGQQKCLK